ADAVKDFIVAAGVEAERLESVGYGEDKPIADNKTEEGKEANRRVEFNILEQEEKLVEAEE
nr:OmpA family protein [Spirochaetota bacterium]